MDINTINSIKNKYEFLDFLRVLSKIDNEKRDIKDYLESVISWVEDMEGFYNNTNQNIPSNINWSFIATLFYVGKIYE